MGWRDVELRVCGGASRVPPRGRVAASFELLEHMPMVGVDGRIGGVRSHVFCDGEAVSAGFSLAHGCHRSAVARCLPVVVESADGRDVVVGDLRVGPFQADEAAVRVVAPTCHVRDADVSFDVLGCP